MMETGDAALLEAGLSCLGELDFEIRHALFDRFLQALPDRRADFLNLDAASRRMTDETLQMLYGLARGEEWVQPMVAELVVTHRNYGDLPIAEYEIFVDMVVGAVGEAIGPGWSAPMAAAWQRQGAALKQLIRQAAADWDRAMPIG